MKSSLKIFLLLISLNINSGDLKQAEDNKRNGNQNIKLYIQYYGLSADPEKNRNWYPFLKTGIGQLLTAAELYFNNSKIKEAKALFVIIEQHIGTLNCVESEELKDRAKKLKEKLNKAVDSHLGMPLATGNSRIKILSR